MCQLDTALTGVPLTLTFDLEFSRSNCISGMGGPIVMERKGRESIGCPDVKHKGNKSTGCCADWGPFDLDIWPWIFKVKLYLGNGWPDYNTHFVTSRQRILSGTRVTKDVGISVDSSNSLYSSRLLHWHWGNLMIAPLPLKQPGRIRVKSVRIKVQQKC